MSGHAERILAALRRLGPMCDDCLAQAAMISPRQAVNTRARELEKTGALLRTTMQCPACRRVKLVNRAAEAEAVVATSKAAPARATLGSASTRPVRADRPWHWEGHIQEAIAQHLVERGYRIDSVADTAARSAGKDIVAVAPDGRPLWVSVKGYPEKSVHVQARHWFAGALLDMARYREESDGVMLAVGLPAGFVTYRRLADSVAKARAQLRFGIYWVASDGTIVREDATD